MASSLLVVDPDRMIGHSIADQLDLTGCDYRIIVSSEDATGSIVTSGEHLLGLVTAIDFPQQKSGWELARLARRANPNVVVGYRSARNDPVRNGAGAGTAADWRIHGVPNSLLLRTPLDEAEMLRSVARLCRGQQGGEGQLVIPHSVQYNWSQTSFARGSDFLHMLFEKAPAFIAFLEGPDHRYSYANEAYLRVVDRPSVVGRTVLEIFPEVVSRGFIDLLDRVYRTGESFNAHEVEFIVQTPHGLKTTYLDLMYYPVREASGEITGIFVQGVDITERHDAQRKIKALQDELIHVSRINALGTLLSALAHELNQPLTCIHNFMAAAKMHAEREQLSGQIEKCLEGTRDAALRAGNVIRRLRDMATRRELAREPIDLEQAVRETIALACVGRLNCTCALGPLAHATVLADRVQIQQVLLNLIQNAFEAGGEETTRVTVSTEALGNYVEVTVRDDGPGIGADVLPTIFDSFITTKSQGMGVGLSICRTIVEAHGGNIKARNNEDGGASFCFTLPKAVDGSGRATAVDG